MAIFTSDEGEGGTTAERVALIGIICFSFSWIPIFIIWKLVSAHRRRTRSQEQEVEIGNMPFQTNPSKPNRDSWKPPPQVQQRNGSINNPQELPPTSQRLDGLEKQYRGKRRPRSNQPADPRIRMHPDIDDTAIEVQHNRSRDLQHGRPGSRLLEQPVQPRRASLRHPSQPVDYDSDESLGTPGPSFGVPPNHQQAAHKLRVPYEQNKSDLYGGRR